ncbi:maleylpyruvate isomerase family mycothiol-dependent enzyme [Acidothermaceae bacterium B102]|nr:maleylpyruvate isomerase family mycothiol-dependent enzyme [Acidothermaceae bacterium B102]
MSHSVWPAIHAERTALLNDVADLTDADWATPSLCSEWTVADVLAHLLSLAKMTPPRFATRFAGARFDFHRFAAGQVALESVGGPTAMVAGLRAAEPRESSPPGPKLTWLGENIVHGEDIRRPLGIRRAYPLSEVTRALTFYAGSNAIIGGKTRIAGLTLEATDVTFAVGTGPTVRGPALALLLASTGRACALDELSGPGLDELRRRP